jgi:hypothetical protein
MIKEIKMNIETLKAIPRSEAIKKANELRKKGYKAKISMIRTGYVVDYWKI